MKVLGINKILEWCQVISSGRKYTCPTKLINGELYFHFKKEWHKVTKYMCENTEELVEEGGKILSRTLKK